MEAKKHHIVVIPEIDMPGHCYAAIKSMEVRYENFARDGDMEKAVEFLPIDKYDILNVESVQMYAENTLNPCLEGTWRYARDFIMFCFNTFEFTFLCSTLLDSYTY